ncbi:MAG: hypothetical protein WBW33_02195 [Bryobacteraceae bacterium]
MQEMPHPTEDALERFAMRKSEVSELEEVEGHVLGCPVCLDRVLELESFVQACRDAIPEFHREQALLPVKARSRSWISRFSLAMPKWSWVPALAALAFMAVMLPNLGQPNRGSFDATLSASRGIEAGSLLPAHTVIRLHLDAIDLPAGVTHVEVVDGEGRPLWLGSATAQADRISVETPRLEPGTYFARLYPTQDGYPEKDHLLREFAFQVR